MAGRSDRQEPVDETALHVRECDLIATDEVWAYAAANKHAIAHNWQKQKQAHPKFFNGNVWLMSGFEVDKGSGRFCGTFLRAEFRDYLYWRGRNFEPAGVWDAFGSGVVVSADGAMVLGEQTEGNVNAGLSYPPSGFIDNDDVARDGTIDIAANIAREISEETGLDVAEFRRRDGYWITFDAAQVSIAAVFESRSTGTQLERAIAAELARQHEAELHRVHLVADRAQLAGLTVPSYTQRLIEALFAAGICQDGRQPRK